MSETITAETGLTPEDHNAWLDWMIYYKGIPVTEANTLTLAEPHETELYDRADQLLCEWCWFTESPLRAEP